MAAPPGYPALRTALTALPATREGFEGLTAELIAHATDGRLRLMSSGEQGGVDAIADASEPGLRRAMQAKRYDQTSLDLNGLIAEMTRAAHRFRQLDSWMLISPQILQGLEQETLSAIATRLGLGLAVIDWSLDAAGLPRLAVLCAAFAGVTLKWLPLVASELDDLQAAAGFAAARSALLADLQRSDLGFAAAQAAAVKRLARVHEDAAAARVIAGASPSLMVQAPPIRRPLLRQQVVDWSAGSAGVLAMLGGEGMGKTWAAIDAAEELAARAGRPLALVISSARAAGAANGLTALVEQLVEIGRDADLDLIDPPVFWRRRIAQWSAPGTGPQPSILLIIDGLDEAPGVDWAEWLAPLLQADHARLLRVVLTCRKDDWDQGIAPSDLGDGLQTLAVGPFSEEERDDYLRSRGIAVEAVPAESLRAALHPRTAFHLTRVALDDGDVARVTRERLLYRDFANRHSIKGGPLTPVVFEKLVRELAGTAQAAAMANLPFAVEAGTVVGRAVAITGHDQGRMRQVLTELLSSSWCERDAHDPTQIRFTDDALPDAVGIALADQVHRLDVAPALAEIDRFLEPWSADGLTDRVLRMCATILVIDPTVPDGLCLALLERWQARSHHSRGAEDFWRRLHIFRPALFLELAARRAGRSGDWLIEWGIASLWEDYPKERGRIEVQIELWLSTLPMPGANGDALVRHRLIYDRDRRRQRRRLRLLERQEPGRWTARIGVEDREHHNVLRTAARIIGFLPREPFVPAIRAWAVTMAAGGRLHGEKDVAALLRDNDDVEDWQATDAAVRAAAKIYSSTGRLGAVAAAHMLRATGDPADAALADSLEPPPRETRTRRDHVARDDAGQLVLVDEARSVPDRWLIAGVAAFAADPDVTLSAEVEGRLRDAIPALTTREVRDLWDLRGATIAGMLRWFPAESVARLRRFISDGPDTDTKGQSTPHQREDYRKVVYRLLPIIPAVERAQVATQIDQYVEATGEGRSIGNALRLVEQPLGDQIGLLLGLPVEAWPSFSRNLLTMPQGDEVGAFLRSLDLSLPRVDLWPRLLLATELLKRFMPLGPVVMLDWAAGFGHVDADVAKLVIRLASRIGGVDAARALIARNWSAEDTPARQAYEGSSVLSQLDDAALLPHLARLDPEHLGDIYLKRPALAEPAFALWRAWMDDKLLVRRTSWGFGGETLHFRDRLATYEAFVERRPDEPRALIRQAWDDAGLRRNVQSDHGEGPVFPLLQALAAVDPELVRMIWRQTPARGGGMFVSSMEQFPIDLAPGALFDDLRAEILGRQHVDDKLFSTVRRLQQAGHVAFLIAQIEADGASDRPLARARALTLAGFLDPSPDVAPVLEALFATSPGAGWLGNVYRVARAWYHAGLQARHWQAELAKARDEVTAYRAFWLLNRVLDDRYALYFRAPGLAVDGDSFRASWLDYYLEGQKSLRKEANSPLEKSYLHSERYNYVLNGR